MSHTITLRATGEVARILGIPRWQLQYLIERGHLPEPSQVVAGRRLFTDEEVEALREALRAREAADLASDRSAVAA